MSAQTNFYNRFFFLYPLVDVFLQPKKKKLFDLINRLPAGRLLEIGVGNGTHFHLYQKHRVTGIEISESMLNEAKKKTCPDIELHLMSGESLKFAEATFDYVVLSHVIAVADYPEEMLKECHRVLRTGGKLIVLNHFTPNNFLKYVDRFCHFFSKLVHLKSLFYMEDILAIRQFERVKTISLKPFSYFKILIFSKP